MSRACKWCGSSEHTQFYCFKKPRKPIKRTSLKHSVKPIKKVGKRTLAWRKTSREWKQANPPDEYGFWRCRVGGARVSDKIDDGSYMLNLCHDKSRARYPELANDLNNIFPGCQRHNKEQGSRSLDEYLLSDHSLYCGDF